MDKSILLCKYLKIMFKLKKKKYKKTLLFEKSYPTFIFYGKKTMKSCSIIRKHFKNKNKIVEVQGPPIRTLPVDIYINTTLYNQRCHF